MPGGHTVILPFSFTITIIASQRLSLARNPYLMKQTSLQFLFAIFIFLIALIFTQPVSAHGEEPRIEISAERLNPGSVLDIRGVAFEADEEIVLSLVGSYIKVPLGTFIADTEGILLATITLPVNLAEGTYVIHATTDDHVLDSPQFTVFGSAELGEGEEQREEDDALLAPMPTFAAAVPTSIAQSIAVVENVAPKNTLRPVVWIAAAIGIVVMLGLLFRGRKS